MSEVIVRMRHIQAAKAQSGGFCARGVSAWFKRHNLDLRRFVREGFPISAFDGIDDEFARKVFQIARNDNQTG